MTKFENIKLLFKRIFSNTEFEKNTFFVGGCVRDFLRKESPHDFDIVTNIEYGAMKFSKFLHKELKQYTSVPFKLGNYPIWAITFTENFEQDGYFFNLKDLTIEIAETMDEHFSNAMSRQRNVEFASIEKDVMRRDFSINSGLINICSGELYFINEAHKSIISDINNGIIKCNDGIDKNKIFSDDPLRMLRGAVFATRFNWTIEEKTAEAIRNNADRIKIVSAERIMKEITKVVDIPKGMYNLIINLDNLNLLDKLFPEVYHQKMIKQQPDIRQVHLEGQTVFHHTISVLRNAKPGLVNSLAALFHDIGKNEKTIEFIDGKIRFIGHEFLGSQISWNILHNMKFSHGIIKKTCFLIKNHMLIHQFEDLSDKSIRRFIRNCGDEETINMLFDLTNADSFGTICMHKDGCIGNIENHIIERQRVDEVIEKDNQVVEKPIRIFNGNELMEALNIKGKAVGDAVSIMLDIQDEHGINVDKIWAMDEIKNRLNENK